jgi:hypothetical protein
MLNLEGVIAMKIMRKGAKADHGVRSIDLAKPAMRWNPTQDTFDLKFAGPTYDFATTSRHNYTMRIQPSEMASIISQLAEQAMSMDADEFTLTFRETLPSLLRLQMMASGVKLAA